jgi:iron complex transport system permease protein
MTRAVTLLAGAISCLFVLGLTVGEQPLSVAEIVSVLTGDGEASAAAGKIVLDIRLPRLLLAILVGMALATAGALAQTVMQNPLAEPGLLGINAGAALAALVFMVFLRETAPHAVALAAFGGASILAVAIYALAWRGGVQSFRIILIGIGLSALCGAAANLITAFGDITAVQQAQVWLAGTLYLANWDKVALLAILFVPVLALCLLLARELDLVALGEDVAAALGQRIQAMRMILLALCVVLSAAAVSATGLIGFVGLVAPHIARGLVGQPHGRLLPVAGLTGALLLLAADLVGRTVIAPAQFPAGLVTALIGAPVFAVIFWKSRNAA